MLRAAPLRSSTLEEFVNCGFEPSRHGAETARCGDHTCSLPFLVSGAAIGICGLVWMLHAHRRSPTVVLRHLGRAIDDPHRSRRRGNVASEVSSRWCPHPVRSALRGDYQMARGWASSAAVALATLPGKSSQGLSGRGIEEDRSSGHAGPNRSETPWPLLRALPRRSWSLRHRRRCQFDGPVSALATRLTNGVSLE